MSRWLGILLLGCLVLLGRPARADSFVSLDLQVPLNEEPGHLCIVTARATKLIDARSASSKKKSAYSSLPLKALVLDAHGRIAAIPKEVQGDSALESILRALTIALPRAPSSAGGSNASGRPQQPEELSPCAQPFGECDARFDQMPTIREWFDKDLLDKQKLELHLTCGWNVAHPNTSGPVVFVALNLIHSADVPVTEIRLDGSAAAVRFAGTIDGTEAAAVRVIGGHYAPSLTVFTTGGRAVLPLQPRCLTSIVQLPLVSGIASQITRVTLQRQETTLQDLRACRPEISEQSFRLRLPFHEERVEHYLKATLGAEATLEAHWFEPVPPSQINLQLKQVGFVWKPDCAYALSSLGCPRAWLEGVECSLPTSLPPGSKTCAYTCSAAGSFKLPAQVEFSADQARQKWVDRLGRPAEELSGVSDTRVRPIRVDFSQWSYLPDVERSQIDGVDIRLPDRSTAFVDLRGKVFNLDQKSGQNVKLEDEELSAVRFPCGAPMLYRVRGLPRYSPNGSLNVDDGRIVVPSPRCSELKCAGIESTLRVGLLSRGARGGIDSSVFGTGVYVQGDFVGRYVPWGGWWFGDSGYTFGVGNREYVGVDGSSYAAKWAPYGRVGIRYAIGVRTPDFRPVLPVLHVGIGIEGGYGHVLTLGGAGAMGGDFYVAPNAFLRFGRVAIAFRVLWFEELAFIDERKAALVKAVAATYYGYELRYHFDLNP